MSQNSEPSESPLGNIDPGPGTAMSFGLCLLLDFAITFFLFASGGAIGKLGIYVVLFVPLVANGIAIWYASATKRQRCLKGLIICTAFLVLLDSACVGLSL